MRPLPANPKQYSGMSAEARAAIRLCLNERVVVTVDCDESYCTTYGGLEAMIAHLFFEGYDAVYADGMCIVMNYARHKSFAPEMIDSYAHKLLRAGIVYGQLSALTGLNEDELRARYGARTKKGKGNA